MEEILQKEIDRIKEIADMYLRIQSLLPKYKEPYLDAYVDLANRLEKSI